MATIEERAKEMYPKGVGVFTPAGAELLQKAYCYGATDQQKIDIEKACEWIMNTPMYAKQPNQLVEEFRKAMEE